MSIKDQIQTEVGVIKKYDLVHLYLNISKAVAGSSWYIVLGYEKRKNAIVVLHPFTLTKITVPLASFVLGFMKDQDLVIPPTKMADALEKQCNLKGIKSGSMYELVRELVTHFRG